jgi:acetoin utilization deacetylase AcuC-like enzyme
LLVYYNHDYVGSTTNFDTTRKAGAIARSLVDRPIPGVAVVDPAPFVARAETLIGQIHDPVYVDAVKTGRPPRLAASQGFEWDPGIWPMAVAHCAGLVAATDDVLCGRARTAGSLSSGLHHARREHGQGFCTFNGLAVAVRHAQSLGASKILVLDVDAHCGGGTYSIVGDDVAHYDISIIAFDDYQPRGDSRLWIADPEQYLPQIAQAVVNANGFGGPFDLVIYNAGMDPINSGVDADTLAQREAFVADWAEMSGQRLVFALAGGYSWGNVTEDDLVSLHRYTIESMARTLAAA